MKDRKKIIVILLAVVVAVAAAAGYLMLGKGQDVKEGSKTIAFTVISGDSKEEFTIKTDETYLRGALEQEGLVKGTVGEFGLFVNEVNGIVIDSSKEEWWCFTKGGEMLSTGIEAVAIADGEAYEATLRVGYEF